MIFNMAGMSSGNDGGTSTTLPFTQVAINSAVETEGILNFSFPGDNDAQQSVIYDAFMLVI